jgi:phage repressor protein C with HTH and peptisase S24 domain
MSSCALYLPVGKVYVNPRDIYQEVIAAYNSKMDIYETRRTNLQSLIEERFGGTQRKLAEAIDRQPDYVSRCLRGHKRIGEKFAVHIEESLNLPAGYLSENLNIFATAQAIGANTLREKVVKKGVNDPITNTELVERANYEQAFNASLFSDEHEPDDDGFSEKPSVSVKPSPDELEFVGRMDVWDSKTPLDDDEVELPLFREVELAAGAGQTQVIENHGAKLRFAKSTLSRAGVQKEHAACAFVRGNSMEPVMPDGTCVGVDTGDTTVRDGEIYAIEHGGMLRVKYLQRRPGGGIKIVSQNSIEHEAEDYTATRVVEENIRVIGRVFWWSVLR